MKWAFVASLVCTFIVYSVGLSGPLVFDDTHNLAPLGGWLAGERGWRSVVFGNESGPLGRPVAMASFLLNIAAFGPDVYGLKLVNLVIHLVNGTLVYWFFRRLLAIEVGGGVAKATPHLQYLPWLAATIWLLHPHLVSTVLYVVQRMTLLSATFTLLALISYLYGRSACASGDRRAAVIGLTLVLAFTVLATLAKESGILAPALCAVLELFLFSPSAGRRRAAFSKIFIAAALFVPLIVAIIFLFIQPPLLVSGYANRPFTLDERLFTQLRVLWDYVGSVLLMKPFAFGLYHDDYILSTGWFSPPTTFVAAIAWIATLLAAWHMRRTTPGFGAGLGIFLVGHALESTAFPLLLYFEHRSYLPAVGLIWALLSLCTTLARRVSSGSKVFGLLPKAGAACVLVLLVVTTLNQAQAWSSTKSLLAQGLKHHPGSRWLRADLISNAMNENPPDVAEALSHTRHMLSSSEASTRRLGAVSELLIYCSRGQQAPESMVHAAFAGRPEPLEADLLKTFESLSTGVASQPCSGLSPATMAAELTAMLDRSELPASEKPMWHLRYQTAILYATANQPEDSLRQATKAWESGKADPQVAVFLVDRYLALDDLISAQAMLDAAASRTRGDDLTGQKILREYKEYLSALSKHQNQSNQ